MTTSIGVYQTPRSFTKLGIEGFEERLVEVLYGVAFFERGKERGAIHAVERRARLVEDFGQIHRFQLAGFGDLVKQFAEDRYL